MLKEWIGAKKYTLDTPCLLIDINILRSNLEIMRKHSIENNINIRPHCKTHKCSKLAQLQIEYGSIGISAAKISEAEILINHKVLNVLLTSPIVSINKIARFISCVEKAPDIMLVVDNEKNILDLNKAACSINKKINVLVDLDPGLGRTGVKFEQALDFAQKIISLKGLNLVGVQCYAGNLQHIPSYEERKKKSLQIMRNASNVIKKFRSNGLPCSIFTGTGTGTYDIDIAAEEITEIQPGSYVVMDVEYAAIGSKGSSQGFHTFGQALSMLTTVISSNRSEHVTVDAGTKSIYVDPIHKPKIISHKGLHYDWGGFGDEHGKITSEAPIKLPSNGDVIELIVPHCDPTINLFDKFFIIDNEIVVDIWDIDLRGKNQ